MRYVQQPPICSTMVRERTGANLLIALFRKQIRAWQEGEAKVVRIFGGPKHGAHFGVNPRDRSMVLHTQRNTYINGSIGWPEGEVAVKAEMYDIAWLVEPLIWDEESDWFVGHLQRVAFHPQAQLPFVRSHGTEWTGARVVRPGSLDEPPRLAGAAPWTYEARRDAWTNGERWISDRVMRELQGTKAVRGLSSDQVWVDEDYLMRYKNDLQIKVDYKTEAFQAMTDEALNRLINGAYKAPKLITKREEWIKWTP